MREDWYEAGDLKKKKGIDKTRVVIRERRIWKDFEKGKKRKKKGTKTEEV